MYLICFQEKLAYFRIKELKDVLSKLVGLSKQGKKQDLVDRIFAILSDEKAAMLGTKKESVAREKVAKLVNDAYRRMQASGASDSPSKGQSSSDISNVKAKGELEDSFQPAVKVRCICGSSLETESMIQCEDPRCHVWEHVGCVTIPEKPFGGNPPLPDSFYCEVCKLTRADPFWLTVAHPFFPARLTATNIPTDGTKPMQSVDRTFQITRTDKDLLVKQEYDVQAWCMLLNDKVLFRMQWPQYADLQVNGVPFRAINRPGSQLLGANGRDDGPIITPCIRDGINKIFLSGCDSRSFCLGVRLVKRRSLQQVLNMIPEEAKGEPFEVALARVRRCIGGAAGNDNADSDIDIEVVADFGNNGMELDSLSVNVARSQTKSPFHSVGNGGLICLLKNCLVESKTTPLESNMSLLSGDVDHFQSTKEDEGWGCGWRNIQMQCSHLLSRRDGEEAKRVLFGGCNVVPDIPSLQRWLELAWKNGFDVSGGLHFGNHIYGCKKWIGTTECAALLRSFGLRARVVDFVPGSAVVVKREKEVDTRGSSSSRISKGAVLMEWVWSYFSDNRLDVSSGVHITNKGPLYFQHEGHSRTIVGIQRRLQGTTFTPQYNLLILDPADFTRRIEKALVEKRGWEGYLKRGTHTLTCPEYQILYVDNGIAFGEELEQLKTIDSQLVEF